MFQVKNLLAIAFLIVSCTVNAVNSAPIPEHYLTTYDPSEVIREPVLFKRMKSGLTSSNAVGVASQKNAANVVDFTDQRLMFSFKLRNRINLVDENENTFLNFIVQSHNDEEGNLETFKKIIDSFFSKKEFIDYISRPNKFGATVQHPPNMEKHHYLNELNVAAGVKIESETDSHELINSEPGSLLAYAVYQKMSETVEALKKRGASFTETEEKLFDLVITNIKQLKVTGQMKATEEIGEATHQLAFDQKIGNTNHEKIMSMLHSAGIATACLYDGNFISLLEYAYRTKNDSVLPKLSHEGTKVSNTEADITLADGLKSEDDNVLQMLVDAGFDFNSQPPNDLILPPLFSAISDGNKRNLEILLGVQGTDVNKILFKGFTPLTWAVEKKKLAMVQVLLRNEKIEVNAVNSRGQTALHLAATSKDLDIIQALLDVDGIEVNAVDENGKTPLQYAAETGDKHVIEKFVQAKGLLNANVDVSKDYPLLCWAAQRGHCDIVRGLFEIPGINLNAVTTRSETALLFAVISKDLELVKALIGKKVNLNIQDAGGRAPLHFAIEKKNEEIARVLIEAGADVNVGETNKYSPLTLAGYFEQQKIFAMLIAKPDIEVNLADRDGNTPLHYSVGFGDLDFVKLLISRKAELNAVDENDQTPLHWAAEKGHKEIAEFLLDNGAELNAVDKSGRTPLFSAFYHDKIELATFLLTRGEIDKDLIALSDKNYLHCAAWYGSFDNIKALVEMGVDFHARDKSGFTPLHSAAAIGNANAIHALIDRGAIVDSPDKDGNSPLYWAVINENEDAVKALISSGANVNFKNGLLLQSVLEERNGKIALAFIAAPEIDVNITDEKGQTLLHLAAKRGDLVIVEALINKGITSQRKNRDGQTPYDLAKIYSQRRSPPYQLVQIQKHKDVANYLSVLPVIESEDHGNSSLNEAIPPETWMDVKYEDEKSNAVDDKQETLQELAPAKENTSIMNDFLKRFGY